MAATSEKAYATWLAAVLPSIVMVFAIPYPPTKNNSRHSVSPCYTELDYIVFVPFCQEIRAFFSGSPLGIHRVFTRPVQKKSPEIFPGEQLNRRFPAQKSFHRQTPSHRCPDHIPVNTCAHAGSDPPAQTAAAGCIPAPPPDRPESCTSW